jgi:hypothetical protein
MNQILNWFKQFFKSKHSTRPAVTAQDLLDRRQSSNAEIVLRVDQMLEIFDENTLELPSKPLPQSAMLFDADTARRMQVKQVDLSEIKGIVFLIIDETKKRNSRNRICVDALSPAAKKHFEDRRFKVSRDSVGWEIRW